MAAIVALSITGAYAINNGYMEMLIVLALAVLGFVFERLGIPLAPVVLGLMLGSVVESNFMQSVIKTNWDFSLFFTRPVSAVLIVLTALLLAYPFLSRTVRGAMARRRARRANSADVATEADAHQDV